MKLMRFHPIPYADPPGDFRDKHPSVWVDIHSSQRALVPAFSPELRAAE